MSVYNEKAKATDEIINSVRDLYTLKLKIPLGSTNLKLLHTNQFLFTELPTDVFELANMEIISKALTNKYSRYAGYQLNRWYIENVTITCDKSNFYMELSLNPFPTSFVKYKDDMRSVEKAYRDAFTKNTTNTPKTNVKKTVKSTTNEIKLYNVKGFKKSDQEYIKKVVTEALKKANNPKNKAKQAKAIHEYYKSKHLYHEYYDMPKMCSGGFESCWKKSNHNCGDGAATLRAMLKCIGLEPDIYLGHGHYWIKVKIDGTYYFCDQSGGEGQHNWRTFGKKGNNNNVWKGTSGGSVHNSYC